MSILWAYMYNFLDHCTRTDDVFSVFQLYDKKALKNNQLESSNLRHLQGLMSAIQSLPNVTAILQTFQAKQGG